MSDFYDQLRKDNLAISKEFAQDGYRYVKLTPASGPAQNPGLPGKDHKDIEGATGRAPEFTFLGGSLIVQSDVQVNFPTQDGIEPSLKDFIEINGVEHKIISLVNVPPTETILHKVFCRK